MVDVRRCGSACQLVGYFFKCCNVSGPPCRSYGPDFGFVRPKMSDKVVKNAIVNAPITLP